MVVEVKDILERAVRDLGIPISGVSVGSPTVRATWRVDYLDSATSAQRAQGDALLQTIDPQDPAIISSIKADVASQQTGMDLIIALGQAAYELVQTPSNFPTIASFRQRVLTIYRNRL